MGIEKTRERIVSVAERLFSRFGFRKTSMDEIARTSRKAKGSLYYHFPSKEELFREVVQNEIAEIKSSLSQLLGRKDMDPGAKLQKYILTRMARIQQATSYHELLEQDQYGHFDFAADLKSDFEQWEKENLTALIKEGQALGAFRPDPEAGVLGEMFIMVSRGLEPQFFIEGKYYDYLAHLEGMAEILLKGLRQDS